MRHLWQYGHIFQECSRCGRQKSAGSRATFPCPGDTRLEAWNKAMGLGGHAGSATRKEDSRRRRR